MILKKYKKFIFFFFLSLIIIGLSIFFFLLKKNFFHSSKKSLYEFNYAREAFSNGFITQSLHGEIKKNHLGFLRLSSEYPFTKEGNISNFYAGICYYKLKNYEQCIKMMNNFSVKDEILCSMKYGIIGDSYSQMKKNKKAIKNYLKAASIRENEITTPLYYYKAALLNLTMKKYKVAQYYLDKINRNYPLFLYRDYVEKYLMFVNKKNQSLFILFYSIS